MKVRLARPLPLLRLSAGFPDGGQVMPPQAVTAANFVQCWPNDNGFLIATSLRKQTSECGIMARCEMWSMKIWGYWRF